MALTKHSISFSLHCCHIFVFYEFGLWLGKIYGDNNTFTQLKNCLWSDVSIKVMNIQHFILNRDLQKIKHSLHDKKY